MAEALSRVPAVGLLRNIEHQFPWRLLLHHIRYYTNVPDGVHCAAAPARSWSSPGGWVRAKTTLLKALVGLTPVSGGAILWNGEAVRDPAAWFRYPVCTYVPQEPHLLSVSIRDNVVLEPGPGTAGRAEAVDAALQAAALARDVARLPRGAETVVGTAGTKLSGGQRQRLASARAFFHGAPLVVLDGPCSALDPATEREYLAHVRRMAHAGALCVVSGTGKALLRAADRIVVLRHGAIEAVATLSELLAGDGELTALWDSPPHRK